MTTSCIKTVHTDCVSDALQQIADNIIASSRGKTLFDAPEHLIIIPPKINRSFVEMELADRGAALAKVGFDTLDWSILRLAKRLGAEGIECYLTQRDIYAHLLMLLTHTELITESIGDTDLQEQSLNYLEDYLPKDTDPGDPKKYALAASLSRLLVKYAEERPDIIEDWDGMEKWTGSTENPAEPLEFGIYKALREKGSFSLDIGDKGCKIPPGTPMVHVLGYDYIPVSALRGLGKLARAGVDITIYTEKLRVFPDDLCSLTDDWNAVSRKAAGNFAACGIEVPLPVEQTAEELKEELAAKGPRILPCPGPGREAEAVWSSICSHLDKGMDPRDICVLVCQTDKYYPEMQRVFAERGVPFNLACVNPSHGSAYLEGISALFDLAGSNMERFRVEALFRNACFLNRHGLDWKTVSDWLKAMEEAGAWEFFDEAEKDDAFKDLGLAEHTWKNTGRRFRLSDATEETWAGLLPADGRYRETGKRLLALVELLHSDLEALRDLDRKRGQETNDEIFGTVRAVIGNWLRPGQQESSIKGYVDNRLGEFRTQCDLRNYAPSVMDIRCFLETFTDPMQFRRGRAFTDGIMAGHIRNIKMPCFKLLYLMGFNEDNFPGRDDDFSLDLSAKGENPALTDSAFNRRAFLKALLSAEKVYMTYDCRDRLKDTELYPSSCITELMDLCGIGAEKALPLFAREKINTDRDSGEDWTLTYHRGDMEEYRAERVGPGAAPEEDGGREAEEAREEPEAGVALTADAVANYLVDPGNFWLKNRLGFDDFGADRQELKYIPPATVKQDKWRYSDDAFTAYLTREDCSPEQAAREAYGVYRQKGLAPEGPLAEAEEELFAGEFTKHVQTLKQTCAAFEEIQFECEAGSFTVSGSAIVGKGDRGDTVFIPKELNKIRYFVKACVLGAVYILSGKAEKAVFLSGTDGDWKLWEPGQDLSALRGWLEGVCRDMAEGGFYSAPAPLLYKKLYKDENGEKQFAPYESGKALADIYLEDINEGSRAAHYWHLLLKDYPRRLRAPSREEYENVKRNLTPVFRAYDTKQAGAKK